MYKLVRLSPVMFFIFMISGIIAEIAAFVQNYERKLYDESSKYTTTVGYPAGIYIPRVTSIEDIMKCDYFTVELKPSDIAETDFFQLDGTYKDNIIHDSSEDEETPERIWIKGKIAKKICRILDNSMEIKYNQFYILKLKNGEKVIAYFYGTLFDLRGKDTIVLPIGKVKRTEIPVSLDEFRSTFNVASENTEWYIDMTGTEWQNNVLDNSIADNRMGILTFTFIFTFIVLTFILYKYAEIKMGDELEKQE